MAGLIGSAAMLKRKLGKEPCGRCGLYYNPKKRNQCPYCGDLDEQGLARLMERIQRQHRANRKIGYGLMAGAAFLLALLVFGNAL